MSSSNTNPGKRKGNPKNDLSESEEDPEKEHGGNGSGDVPNPGGETVEGGGNGSGDGPNPGGETVEDGGNGNDVGAGKQQADTPPPTKRLKCVAEAKARAAERPQEITPLMKGDDQKAKDDRRKARLEGVKERSATAKQEELSYSQYLVPNRWYDGNIEEDFYPNVNETAKIAQLKSKQFHPDPVANNLAIQLHHPFPTMANKDIFWKVADFIILMSKKHFDSCGMTSKEMAAELPESWTGGDPKIDLRHAIQLAVDYYHRIAHIKPPACMQISFTRKNLNYYALFRRNYLNSLLSIVFYGHRPSARNTHVIDPLPGVGSMHMCVVKPLVDFLELALNPAPKWHTRAFYNITPSTFKSNVKTRLDAGIVFSMEKALEDAMEQNTEVPKKGLDKRQYLVKKAAKGMEINFILAMARIHKDFQNQLKTKCANADGYWLTDYEIHGLDRLCGENDEWKLWRDDDAKIRNNPTLAAAGVAKLPEGDSTLFGGEADDDVQRKDLEDETVEVEGTAHKVFDPRPNLKEG